jgi:hypothetical protein
MDPDERTTRRVNMLPVLCVVNEGEAVAAAAAAAEDHEERACDAEDDDDGTAAAAGATRPSASSDGRLVTPPPSSPSAAMVRAYRSIMSRAAVLDAALAGRREAEAEAGRSSGT